MTVIVSPNDISKVLNDTMSEFYSDMIKGIAKQIVDNAPADTGVLKGSVMISEYPDSNIGSPDPTGTSTKAKLSKVMINSKDDMYISIGAPYAKHVEYGTLYTRPNGFVRRALSNTQNIATKVAKKL